MKATPTVQATETSTLFIAKNIDNTISVAEIKFITPGPNSQLLSPIRLHALLQPGDKGHVRIELFGSNARLLARQILVFETTPEMDAEIDFETSHQKETARLVVSTQDEFGRLQALNSIDLVLLSEGNEVINPPADPPEEILISSPQQGEVLYGGIIKIAGTANIEPGRPLDIKLIDREGRVLTFGEVYPKFEKGETWGTFEIAFTYTVKESTWAQIAITENGVGILGPMHFTAIEVQLAP